ncbi:MAG: ParB N-terminal domain-containing protein [Pirellulales bacterium]|nr:ParB N-terminal domain-containing protein [Pirellulales bacterium]
MESDGTMVASKNVRMAFEQQGILLPLDKILPRRQLKPRIKDTPRYKRIVTSIKVIGVVEPLVVFPQDKSKGQYILLDGHFRLEALKDLGERETFCLIATDDESFTYDHHVCVMTTIQEHFMISRAIANGVPSEKIAEMLCLDVKTIRGKQGLLQGICDEAVELLKDKAITTTALREFRRVAPMRQIEMAELMIASNNFTVGYLKCLLAATPVDQLLETGNKSPKSLFSAEDLGKIEREMETISQEMRTLEETHGRNVLNLVIVVGYLKKLLASASVVKYFARKHPDLLSQFQKLVETTSLDGGMGELAASPS